MRARKLAEATAAVNELLMAGNSLVNTALSAPDASAARLGELMSQVGDCYKLAGWLAD